MNVTTCPRCAQTNPADARYCHADGVALVGLSAGPLDLARQAFPRPLVFPDGRSCGNFAELGAACEAVGPAAADLLAQGVFHAFFSAIGRGDLATVAAQAAAVPDRERALDRLMSQFPGATAHAPRLRVSPKRVDLGAQQVGRDAELVLELSNEGGRLLFGTVASECDWLTPKGSANGAARLVQFRRTCSVFIHVPGQSLRAAARPLEGRLVIETNGGTEVVEVTAEVPITPFAAGPLAGARTPREIAEKAKRAPKDVAPLFESGAVVRWYQANGWTYPVQGPAASGIGAVQQFFEALGLTRPPKVRLGETRLQLRGSPGETVRHALRVFTTEGRPVFAHGRCDHAGVIVRPAILKGVEALLPIEMTVPDRPGKNVEFAVLVTANGGQQFAVPVMLSVAQPAPRPAAAAPAVAAAAAPIRPIKPVAAAVVPAPAIAGLAPAPPRPAAAMGLHPGKLIHLLPVALLAMPLFGLVVSDFVRDLRKPLAITVLDEVVEKAPAATIHPAKALIVDEPDEMVGGAPKFQIDDEPEERVAQLAPVKVEVKDEPAEVGPSAEPADKTPLVSYALAGGGQSFGISTTGAAPARFKKLTFAANGATNSTVLRLDGGSSPIGGFAGRWIRSGVPRLEDEIVPTPYAILPSHSTWAVNVGGGAVHVHQVLEIVPGQATLRGTDTRRAYDTVVVRWILHNRDKKAHQVGLRLQLDTLIGNNDGVPFTVPGRPGLVDTFAEFANPRDVPDFVQALEFPNLNNPGTVAHLTLKLGSSVEAPSRLSLTAWPGGNFNWDIPVRSMGADSAAVLYWPQKALEPGARRTIGFAYGLGNVTYADKLGLTLGGSFEPGQHFTATAYVENPAPGQTVRLELPAGLKRIDGAETQTVAAAKAGAPAIVTWKVEVEQTGTFRLVVHSSTGIKQAKTVAIARPDIPTGKLAIELDGSFEPGQTFGVAAKVSEGAPGQTLRLHLPAGLKIIAGDPSQPVPLPAAGAAEAIVRWKVQVLQPGKFPVRVAASTGIARTKTITIAGEGRVAANFRVSLDGAIAPDKVFTVTAHLLNFVDAGQTFTLRLPPGVQHVGGAATQSFPKAGADAPVIRWQVKVPNAGKFSIGVASSTGITQKKSLVIEAPGAETGRFRFDLVGDVRVGQTFDVVAHVADPVAGQTLTLTLPRGLKLLSGAERQPVAAGAASVTWRVRVLQAGRLPVRVESSTGPVRTKTIVLAETDSTLFGQ